VAARQPTHLRRHAAVGFAEERADPSGGPIVAHAKDKGGSKNTKKKAQKSIKEKRAVKKSKKDGRER
jgi:hypothetical protein